MKQIRKVTAMAGCMLLGVSLLVGCGSKSVTADSLMKEVQEKTKDMKSMTAEMILDLGMKANAEGVDMDIDMIGKFNMDVISKPQACHMTGVYEISTMGISMDMDSYIVEEDGKLITYMNMMDQWTKQEAEMPDQDTMDSLTQLFSDEVKYTLEDETEKSGDKELYVLQGKITGDTIASMMGEMSGMTDTLTGEEDIDWSKMSMDTTMKIDKNTKLPETVIVDCTEGMTGILDATEEVSVSRFLITINYIGFDNVEKIEVPEDAVANAVDVSEIDDSDFINTESDVEDETAMDYSDMKDFELNDENGKSVVKIQVPEGYEVIDYNADDSGMIQKFDENNAQSEMAIYYLASDVSLEDINDYFEEFAKMLAEEEGYSEIKLDDSAEVKLGKQKVEYRALSYLVADDTYDMANTDLMMVVDLGDGLTLVCEASAGQNGKDYPWTDIEKVVRTLLAPTFK